ncbi:MAG: YhjD/YihY/BrkB family envelope integrity protein [Gammaproteobacteria bacterium]|jgi:membrane protein|nr:YhjD/YihY/BrkB family envelope integrity protein [Gammaproteobacteria bacterium]
MDDLLLSIESALWHKRLDALPTPGRLLVTAVRFVYAILRDVLTTTLTLRAMGLVYITIMSIVPMLALAFSALKGFGIHRSRVEPALKNFLEPLGEQGVVLTSQLIGFVDNVQGGLLAGAGLIFLFYTTVSMIKKVEDSLNFIWRVDNARSFVQRFGEYLSIVLVGPLIMFTAVGLIATVGSNALVDDILAFAPLGATAVMIGKAMPYILVSIAFAGAYWFIPNTRVRFSAALFGGFTGGLLWATVGVLFATFVVNSTRNADIYASFAVVIIALIWLYISWVVLLIGAQTSFYVQNPEYLRVGYKQLNLGNELVEQMALSMMLLVARTFRDGSKGLDTNSIAEMIGVPGMLLTQVRQRLMNQGLLDTGSHDTLIPARDPSRISIAEVFAAVRGAHDADIYTGGHWPAEVTAVFDEIAVAAQQPALQRSLYELLDAPATPASVAGESHPVDQH